MPRGVKGSGKKPVNSKKPATEKKERKAYPTYQERIEAADKKMEQLQKLIASREALISQTEAKLAERKEALAKSQEKGVPCRLEDIEKDIADRDYKDMHREHAPLRQAEDAVLVDSSQMSIEQVAEAILGIAGEKGWDVSGGKREA